MKSLITMAIATIIGLVIVPVLTIVGVLVVGPIASVFLPEPSNTGMGFANLGIGVAFIFVIYFSSTLVAGFTAGFLVYRWELKIGSQIWQSFLSGFVIGIIPPTILYLAKSSDLIYFAVLALFSGVAGVIGYYVAGRKYRQQTSE